MRIHAMTAYLRVNSSGRSAILCSGHAREGAGILRLLPHTLDYHIKATIQGGHYINFVHLLHAPSSHTRSVLHVLDMT